MPRRPQGPEVTQRPDIYRYHEYRSYLNDWVAYRRSNERRFSLRKLAREAGLASGYLPAVLSGARPLTLKTLPRLLPHLDLNPSEQDYLENLVKLCTAPSHEARHVALDRMKSSGPYRKRNPNEAELIEYMSRWHYIAIRELAALPGFQLDPDWIQSKLKVKVPLSEIRAALEFLTSRGYLEVKDGGVVVPVKEELRCIGGVYRTALTEYHRRMFELATQSIENTPSTERNLLGYTMPIDPKGYETVQRILQDALEKISALSQRVKDTGDSVYHIELAIFPLTQKGGAV